MLTIKVKICCIASIEEANLAIKHGATAIGLVGPMPSGPGIIEDDKIAHIAANLPPSIDSFLLTSETNSQDIIRHHQRTKTTTIQMVDELTSGTYEDLRAALPHVKLVQVIHVLDQSSIQHAQRIAPKVDAILLDSGNPSLKIKTLGGTGKTHNWEISKAIVDSLSCPVYLAGGLRAENIQEAIQSVQADGVDLCSGVRTEGKLDPVKLRQFFEAFSKA